MTPAGTFKNLREYIIDVDIPEGKVLHGVIPYDVTISKNKGRIKVFASSKEEAERQIKEFLSK